MNSKDIEIAQTFFLEILKQITIKISSKNKQNMLKTCEGIKSIIHINTTKN